MAGEYIVGQLIELVDEITDPRSTPTPEAPINDPTDAVIVYLPDGSSETPSVTHGVTGEYSALFTSSQSGWHTYVFSSTTSANGKGRGRFYVSPVP